MMVSKRVHCCNVGHGGVEPGTKDGGGIYLDQHSLVGRIRDQDVPCSNDKVPEVVDMSL